MMDKVRIGNHEGKKNKLKRDDCRSKIDEKKNQILRLTLGRYICCLFIDAVLDPDAEYDTWTIFNSISPIISDFFSDGKTYPLLKQILERVSNNSKIFQENSNKAFYLLFLLVEMKRFAVHVSFIQIIEERFRIVDL